MSEKPPQPTETVSAKPGTPPAPAFNLDQFIARRRAVIENIAAKEREAQEIAGKLRAVSKFTGLPEADARIAELQARLSAIEAEREGLQSSLGALRSELADAFNAECTAAMLAQNRHVPALLNTLWVAVRERRAIRAAAFGYELHVEKYNQKLRAEPLPGQLPQVIADSQDAVWPSEASLHRIYKDFVGHTGVYADDDPENPHRKS